MTRAVRYFRLWLAFAHFALLGELAFRANFILKMVVEVLWLSILLMFYETIFTNAQAAIAGWNKTQYYFFVGCYFALEGLIETLFLENCQDFSQQIRTGQLDTSLLQPIDEQFMVTLRKVDWSTVPNFLMGSGVMVMSLIRNPDWSFNPWQVGMFVVVFASSVLLAYSFLLLLTSSAVWMVRNQSLMELWWLFSSLMRYPREIFNDTWARQIGWAFTFILPVMLVIGVPAGIMVKALDWRFALYLIVATAVMLAFSRWFFRRALRRYRSASS